jgi:hypothetical protein
VSDAGRPVLVGLVLGGFRCGDPNYPAIFTQVSAGLGFLRPYLDPDSLSEPVRGLAARRTGADRRNLYVRWREPTFDGGAKITQYVVTVQPGGRHLTVRGRVHEVRIPNIADDHAVTVSVAARNAVGLGPASTVEVPA